MRTLGVGIIGANPQRGWAKGSHVPAVQNLEGLQLVAVGSGSAASAKAAARAFGVERAYGTASELCADPEVSIVAIAVRVPAHRTLILEALAAGKHVYCEWPLGRNVAETAELAEAARKAGVHVAIGLQARASPVLRQARALLESGSIGRVLNARIESETIAFGPQTEAADVYLNDHSNGATLITIHAGHAIDTAEAVLGDLTDVQALTTVQFPQVEVVGGSDLITRVIPDLVLSQSRMARGGVLAMEVAGGRQVDPKFRMSIVGERGELQLQGGAARGFQSGRLTLTLNGEPQSIEEGELKCLPDEAFNVGALYAMLRDDINSGTATTPDFEHSLRLARLLDELEVAAKSAARRAISGDPFTATTRRAPTI